MVHPRVSEMLQRIKPMCVRWPYRREQHQNGDAGEYLATVLASGFDQLLDLAAGEIAPGADN
jgi:hypothetical protein